MYGGRSGEFACGYLGLKVLKHVHVFQIELEFGSVGF